MPVAKIQLPDGRIARFEVPEGTTPEQVQAFAEQQVQAGAFAAPTGDPAADVEAGPQKRSKIPRLQDVGRVTEGMVLDTGDGPAIFEGGQFKAIPESEALSILAAQERPRAGDVARQAVTDNNIVERGSILPVGRTKAGEPVLAMPDFLTETARVAAIPGAVAQGAQFGAQELTDFAAVAAPGAAGRVAGANRVSKVASQLPKKLVKKAPSTEKLLKRGSNLIENYKRTGDNVSGDDFAAFWVKADDILMKEGFDAENTPSIAKRMASLARRAENEEITAQEMINIRRGIKSTLNDVTAVPEDKRLANILLDEFDDFALTLPGTQKWAEGRRLYAQGKKSEQIMDVLERAGETASGIENGIRIELRKILKSEKKSRGFTKQELKAMQKIVKGDFTANTLKRLAGLGFGSGAQMNRLGGTVAGGLGAGAGASAFGPAGAVVGAALPGVVGAGASKALEKRTISAVNNLRALVAGAKLPEKVIFKDTSLTPRALSSLAAGGLIANEDEN